MQVDDAVLMHEADTMASRGESWEDYRKWAELRVEGLNHALRGLPEDRVLAGTDCGFAQGAFIRRVHEEIQWAKLSALAEGARIASRELWGVKAES